MSVDWIYPVNEHSDQWGYWNSRGEPVPAVKVMAGSRGARHLWTLSRRLHDFHTGDRIWVRAALPIGRVVGVGVVQTEPEWDENESCFVFEVDFDNDACRNLAASPFDLQLTTSAQSARHATVSELRQLTARTPAAPGKSALPPGKVRRTQDVVVRQGQSGFRARLMQAYGGKCAVTGCDVAETLQAAHIDPYDGTPTNVVDNGLLLRADIHNLLDLGRLWITDSFLIGIHPDLRASSYGAYQGKRLRLPKNASERPSRLRLSRHRQNIAQLPPKGSKP